MIKCFVGLEANFGGGGAKNAVFVGYGGAVGPAFPSRLGIGGQQETRGLYELLPSLFPQDMYGAFLVAGKPPTCPRAFTQFQYEAAHFSDLFRSGGLKGDVRGVVAFYGSRPTDCGGLSIRGVAAARSAGPTG